MKKIRIVFLRVHFLIAKFLMRIGNPNPFFASTMLIGVFLALNLSLIYAVFLISFGIAGVQLSKSNSHVFAVLYMLIYLMLVKNVFDKSKYQISDLRLLNAKKMKTKLNWTIALWAAFSIFSLPMLGVVLGNM